MNITAKGLFIILYIRWIIIKVKDNQINQNWPVITSFVKIYILFGAIFQYNNKQMLKIDTFLSKCLERIDFCRTFALAFENNGSLERLEKEFFERFT